MVNRGEQFFDVPTISYVVKVELQAKPLERRIDRKDIRSRVPLVGVLW